MSETHDSSAAQVAATEVATEGQPQLAPHKTSAVSQLVTVVLLAAAAAACSYLMRDQFASQHVHRVGMALVMTVLGLLALAAYGSFANSRR